MLIVHSECNSDFDSFLFVLGKQYQVDGNIEQFFKKGKTYIMWVEVAKHAGWVGFVNGSKPVAS